MGGECGTYSIGIHHEDVLVECRVDTDDVPHLMIDFEFQRGHGFVEVDMVEILQQEDLRVSLAAITWLVALAGLADFDHHNVSENRLR